MFDRLEKNSPAEKKVFAISAVVGIAALALDIATKYWVVNYFELYESRELISGLLAFTSVRNLGAAWSIFSGYGWVLLAFALVVAAVLCCCFRRITEGCSERYFGLMLLLSGIAGNSLDRGLRGAVVDFIHVHWYDVWHYPIFNVADIAICCGVGLLVLSNLIRKNPEKDSAGEKIS